METISVKLPHCVYDIWIENGLLAQAGTLISSAVSSRSVVVVTDETVDTLYGKRLMDNLAAAGIAAGKIVIPPGEASKSMAMLEQVYSELIQARLKRSDCIIAFGGGVVGDLAGFAAATYLRGVRYIQVPTTLLAQIDSSVGGKVAVNLRQGKNLAGAFHQPAAVLIDPWLLAGLPPRTLRDGMAEAIKYGAIADKDLFERLANLRDQGFYYQAERIIADCCRIKRDVVQADELDTGLRLILNFGHSIGHAIEQVSRFRGFTHGEAVAIGMSMITKRSEQLGWSRAGTSAALDEVLMKLGLPLAVDGLDKNALLAAMENDKKNSTGGMQLVILREIGRAEVVRVSMSEAATFL